MLLWRVRCGTLKMVMCYFEGGDVLLWRWRYVLWRWRCVTLKRKLWYFEVGGVVRKWGCGNMKRVPVGWRCSLKRICGNMKKVVLFFKEGGVVLLIPRVMPSIMDFIILFTGGPMGGGMGGPMGSQMGGGPPFRPPMGMMGPGGPQVSCLLCVHVKIYFLVYCVCFCFALYYS